MLWAAVEVATISTVLSIGLGLWLAWLLVNRRFPGQRELGAALTLALALPAPLLCYVMLFGVLRAWPWGFGGGALLSATPVLVRAARGALTSLDPVYGKAARSLGQSEWRVFWSVEFPLVLRPTLAAVGLAWARVLAEVLVMVLIAGTRLYGLLQ